MGSPKKVKSIDKLTPEQEAMVQPWAEKWAEKGARTDEADWDAFADGAEKCYGFAGLEWPGRIVRVSSPLCLSMAAPLADLLISNSTDGGASNACVEAVVKTAVAGMRETESAARRPIPAGALDVGSEVIKELTHSLDWMAEPILQAVRQAVPVSRFSKEFTRDDVYRAIADGWGRYLGGQFWLSWQAYNSFLIEVCHLDVPEDAIARDAAFSKAQQAVAWWWPHRQFVMASNRPIRMEREATENNGVRAYRLHSDTGPSIQFRDGWALYTAHGIRMPAWIIETPAEKLDARRISTIDNVDVRREFVRKVGIETCKDHLGWKVMEKRALVIDESDSKVLGWAKPGLDGKQVEYEIGTLEVLPGSPRTYLIMRNPSVPGVFHMEAVDPECQTVQHAINYRRFRSPNPKEGDWMPSHLS